MTTPAAAINHRFPTAPCRAVSVCPAMMGLLLGGRLVVESRRPYPCPLVASSLARCGLTTYLGSRADWKPALYTARRSKAEPASTSPPPARAAHRRRVPATATVAAPTAVQPRASLAYRPAGPWW